MTEKILVVEDDRILQNAIKKALVQEGYDVILSNNGEEGVSKIKSEKPDLILLDILMPKKSGLEALKEIKADSSIDTIPVIVLTVRSDKETISECVALGAEAYLIKADYSLEEIINNVKKYIKS